MYQKDTTDNDLIFGFLQVIDLMLNLSQTSNDALMKELQEQDRKYLSKIVSQNNEIKTSLNKILQNMSK